MEQESLVIGNYPFLKKAKDFVEEKKIDFGELLEGELFRSVRDQALARVEWAMDRRQIPEPALASQRELLFELLSYLLGRLLVAHINIDSLIKLYALAEATSFQERLEKEEDPEFLLSILQELGMDLDEQKYEEQIPNQDETDASASLELEFILPFYQYLTYTRRLRDASWKLLNQPMEKGMVLLRRHRLIRLSRELLFDRFYSEISLMKTPSQLPGDFGTEASRLKLKYGSMMEELRADDLGEVVIENIPPCMRSILSLIQAGENVSHAGRFALTAFLHMIGLDNEEILRLNMSSPDFDDRIARYQVEHITGVISQTEYNAQSCKTMDSLGLCVEKDRLCWTVGHPLGYYEARNEGMKDPKFREKHFITFLASYFEKSRYTDVLEILQGRSYPEKRSYMEAAVKRSGVFEKPEALLKLPEPDDLFDLDKLPKRGLFRANLILSPRNPSRPIRRMKIDKGGKERSIHFASFTCKDRKGRPFIILPVLDMALALALIPGGELPIPVVCGRIHLFSRDYLYLAGLGGAHKEVSRKETSK